MAQRIVGDRDAADATLGLALKIAEGLKDPAYTVEALARVAIVQADSGDCAAARATLNRALQIEAIVPALQQPRPAGDLRRTGTGSATGKEAVNPP